jgi:hypothetical protein
MIVDRGYTYRNIGRHGRAALTDTHLEVWEEAVAPVPTPCLLVETLELGHRDVAGDGDLGAIVVFLRRIYGAIAVRILLRLQVWIVAI